MLSVVSIDSTVASARDSLANPRAHAKRAPRINDLRLPASTLLVRLTMASIKDGNAHSNVLFWDSNHKTTFRRFVPWKMISKCRGIGYEGRILYIFIKGRRLRFPVCQQGNNVSQIWRGQ